MITIQAPKIVSNVPDSGRAQQCGTTRGLLYFGKVSQSPKTSAANEGKILAETSVLYGPTDGCLKSLFLGVGGGGGGNGDCST